MGLRTSVYLTDDLEAAWKASGVPLGELVRRGLNAWTPEEASARLAAEAVRDDVRAAQRDQAVEALESLSAELQDRIDRAVERALQKRQGGSW